jgi:mannosyltransferase OCH1-like enzyme
VTDLVKHAAQPSALPLLGHIVWVGGHDEPKECIDSWPKLNPDLIWTVWRDHTAGQGWINQEQIDARAARREWNGVADCIRYELLTRYGGICVDADSTAAKPLSEGAFFDQGDVAQACFESEAARPGVVACGFLAAPKGHPFFRACVEEVGRADPKEMAWQAVGPMLMTRVAQKMPDAIKVWPSRMFIPEHYSGAKAPGVHPIFANQHFGSTTTYAKLRKWPCQCATCRSSNSMLRPSWG